MKYAHPEKGPARRRHLLILNGVLIFLFAVFDISCKKSNDDPSNIDPTTIKGSENLGSGYDVFDNYADVSKVKAAVLDLTKLSDAGLIEVKTVEGSTFTTTSGTTVDEYSSSLSVQASLEGSYSYFSGAVRTNFHKEQYSYESFSFATVTSMIQKTQLRLPVDMTAEDLKPYLTATSKIKLNDPTVTPQYIFNTYGTHCLTGVILGGRLDYSVSAKTSKLMNNKSIGIYAEASFSRGIASVKGSAGLVTNEEDSTFNTISAKTLHVYGGQSEFGQTIILDNDYNAWINSIKDNSVFCNFTQHGLVPIWEFCDDQSRKDELIAAFETWAADRKIVVNPEPKLCILDVLVVYGGNAVDPYYHNERNYNQLKVDLNGNCGGSTPFIWLYYLSGYANDTVFTPLAEIATVDPTDGESIANYPGGTNSWHQIQDDLNKGAGGDLIYFAYRRRTGPTDKLLTGLRVEIQNTGVNVYSNHSGPENQWIPAQVGYYGPGIQDLNEGAGGYLIHLWYTNDELPEN